MKRSEMLDQLAEHVINKWDIPWDEYPGNNNLEEFCDNVLTFLENKGILPPSTLNTNFKGGHNSVIEPYYVNEWEKE